MNHGASREFPEGHESSSARPVRSDFLDSDAQAKEMGWAFVALFFLAGVMLFFRRSCRLPEDPGRPGVAPWTTASARAAKPQETINLSINGHLHLPAGPACETRLPALATGLHEPRRKVSHQRTAQRDRGQVRRPASSCLA